MTKLVDYEAVLDGDNFTFIKTFRDDGSIDPRFGMNGPYEIAFIALGQGVRISHQEGLASDLIVKMTNEFLKDM